jgi:dTDP-D-glucose 4,6-dehydratase
MSVRCVATAVIAAYGGVEPTERLDFGYTRLGLDARYHVDDTKLRTLGWTPCGNLATDLPVLVQQERGAFRW